MKVEVIWTVNSREGIKPTQGIWDLYQWHRHIDINGFKQRWDRIQLVFLEKEGWLWLLGKE